jgi:hypothetical protein
VTFEITSNRLSSFITGKITKVTKVTGKVSELTGEKIFAYDITDINNNEYKNIIEDRLTSASSTAVKPAKSSWFPFGSTPKEKSASPAAVNIDAKFKENDKVTFKENNSRFSFSSPINGIIKNVNDKNDEGKGVFYDITGLDKGGKVYKNISEDLISPPSATPQDTRSKKFKLGDRVIYRPSIISKSLTGTITYVNDLDSQRIYTIKVDGIADPISQISESKLTLVSSSGGGLRRTRRKPALRRTPERGTKQDFLRMKHSK